MSRIPLFLAVILITITTVSSSSISTTNSDLPTTFQRPSYQSQALSHIEHVEWYHLDHEDRHLYNTESVHTGTGLKSHISYPFASRRTRIYNGLTLHFPEHVHLSVRALGQTYYLSLHLVSELKAENSTVITNDGTFSASLTTYRTYRRKPSDTWAVVTFRPDGTFQGLLIVDGEIIGIDHIEQHAQEMDANHYHSMATSAPHGMIAYKYSSFKDTHVHGCGVIHEETKEVSTDALTPNQMRRHLLQSVINDPGNGICNGEPCRWLDDGSGAPCWPGITATNIKSMTFIPMADYGFYQIYNSVPNTQSAIDQTMAVINAIYVPQIGMFNKVIETMIMTQAGSAGMSNSWNYNWNKAPLSQGAKCNNDQGYTINSMLTDLTTYNKQDMSNGIVKASERHIFTNCYPPAGTVGLAWVGTINARGGNGCGVSSYSSSHWLTIAHEVGHNLGAPHTFGPDGTDPNGGVTGAVGGIMDYTQTGKFPRPESGLPGIAMFHPVITRPKICNQLKAAMTNDRSYVLSYIQPWTPTCNNGILEPGEDCDDKSGCCDLSTCRLVSGAQCTPGKGNSNPCCDANTCLYKATQYGCPGGGSYCLMGQCANDGCTKYSNTAQCPNQVVKSPDYPGVATTDACNFGCTYSGPSGCTYPPRASPGSFGTIPDGAVCNDGSGKFAGTTGGKYGVCQGAKCVAVTAPKPAVKYGDVGFVTAAPTNSPPTAAPTQSTKPTTPKPTDPTTVAPTPGDVYSWLITSAFSACFDSSGVKTAGCNIAGTQVRSVACRNSAGTQVPDIYCSNIAKPATSQACRGECTYAWYADPKGWSTCNYDCTSPGISPTQTRAIFCYEQGDTTRSNPLNTDPVSGPCYQTVPPPSVQSCNPQQCPVTLNVPPFDAVCSKDCGGGVQTRTISCIYTQNNRQYNIPQTSTDSRWAPFISACQSALNKEPKPVTSQACNVQACAQFNWRASNFGPCSATCKAATAPAAPTRTRTVTCVETNNGVDTNVADDKCAANLKPVTSETCNAQACAVYSWVLGDWSTCTAKCGGGLQTRSVICKDGNGNAASDGTCTEQVKPISQQTCNIQLCDNFAWRTTEYGVCTVTCGGGTQTRTVSCYNTIVAAPQPTVPDTNCATAGPKPVSQQACSQQACPKYEWLAGDYGNCDKICGVGTRTRSVKCIQVGPNDIVSDSLCTGTKPAVSGACNTNPCQQSNWRTGAWGACSQTCGTGGVRTRVVDCVDQSSNPAQGCDPAIKPASQESCNTQTCPTQWLAGPFGQCSKPCGVGTYTRSVTCVYRDTQKPTGDDSLCSSTQPTASAVCNTFACPTYRAGAWGPCRSPLGCGDGIQTRPLTCFDSFGTQVDIKECASATAPFTQQTCSLDPCPHWHRDPWNDCSQPCGGGLQTRSLTCRMPHDAIWQGQKALNDSLCPDINISGADGDAADSKSGLATIQECNTDPCASYYWNTTYGACSKTCGGGVQLATSTCYSNTGSIANPALCTAQKPAPQRECNTYLCPNYIWKAKEWTQCSVYCGTGTQTRQVYCANISPNAAVLQETVADSFCESQGLPKLASQQNCVNPSDKCAGARSNQVDGVCVTDTTDPLYGKCRCRFGFSGADCKEAPSIYDVTTDAGRVGTGIGVPVGDSLSISWKTTGKIDSVSIVLGQRGGRNPVSRYIIVNKPLRNTASWTVGIGADGYSMKNLLPGSGYFITVFALSSIQGSSEPFSIGDACSVKSCGFGTCRDGQCVCQDAYQGEKCDIPRCTASNCNVNGGKCSLTKQSSGSFCECAPGWQGISCGTPKTCTATCGAGGDLAPFAIDDPVTPACPATASCVCLSNYVFTGGICKCDPGCGPYGTPASDCSGCNCLPGWFGQKCDRIYWTIRTQFIIPSGTSFLQDAVLKTDFGRTTSIDLATAAGFPIERIIVDDISIPGPTTATVSFRLLSVATVGENIGEVAELVTSRGQRSGLFNPATPTAEHHALAARRAAHALQAGLTPSQVTQIAELKQAYAILAAVLGDASSYAWNGVGTVFMDRNYAITLSDASGKSGTLPGPPPKPDTPFTPGSPQGDGGDGGSSSSSSNNMIIIIAAAVAGGIVALIVLAIIIYFCKRTSSSKTSWTKDSAKMELRTFDSFNAGGTNNNAAWASSSALPASSGVASWAKGMSSPSTPAVMPTSYAASTVSPTSVASPTSYTASNVGYNAYTSPANTTAYTQQEGYTANTTAVEANPLTLPAGWSQQFTNDGTPYYFNSLTSQTQWERPGTY